MDIDEFAEFIRKIFAKSGKTVTIVYGMKEANSKKKLHMVKTSKRYGVKPTVLMILDGYGLNDKCEDNAVCEAKTPVMDQLMSQCPYVKGQASGLAVGLPDGQMGNSEVGHLNMGAGRIVYQELTRITKAIQDGDFFENRKSCLQHVENAKGEQFRTSYVRTGF